MSRVFDARETRFGRYLEDFEVGDVYKHWPGKTITEADDHLFCMITMNHHPLHTDAHYAETETQFGKNVVVGNLVYSLVLGMSVPDVSGKAIANLEVESLQARQADVPRRHDLRADDGAGGGRVAQQARPRHRHRGDDRHQPARRGRLRVPPQGAGAEAAGSRAVTPDLILTGGVVHTVNAARSAAEAVAVKDGRIAAVGSAREIAELAGPSTQVVDVEGGMVLPGFHDAHCHLAASGYEATLCDLRESTDPDEHLRRIAEYAQANPDRRVDPGRRLGLQRLSRRHPDAPGARRGRGRPARDPAQPRLPRRLGQLPGAGAGRHRP